MDRTHLISWLRGFAAGKLTDPPKSDSSDESAEVTALLAEAQKRWNAERAEQAAEVEKLALEAQTGANNLRNVIAGTPDALALVDGDGHLMFLNPAAAELFGRPAGDVVGEAFSLPEQDTGNVEISIERPDGSACVAEARVATITWKNAPARLATLRDITDRKQAESLKARLIHADRLAMIGTMAASVAHEINNPASFILTNNSLIKSDLVDLRERLGRYRDVMAPRVPARERGEFEEKLGGKALAAVLDDMIAMCDENESGVDRISRIVKDLRTFARVETDTGADVDVNEVVQSAINMVSNQIRHCAKLVLDLQTVPSITGDSGRLGQVVMNMLVNAVQAVDHTDEGTQQISVTTGQENGQLFVRVEDTGRGIPDEVLGRVFEPFFTTKPGERGTGLGLSLCEDIAKQHGGRMAVSSRLGHGSCFELWLPAVTGLSAQPEPLPPRPRTVPTASARILIIDDEPMLLRAFSRVLRASHEVVTVDGGLEALELLKRDTQWDLVICDLMMPDADGPAIHAYVSDHAPELLRRIVFCTGGAFTPWAEQFLAATKNLVLRKPVRTEDLQRVVSKVVGAPEAEVTKGPGFE